MTTPSELDRLAERVEAATTCPKCGDSGYAETYHGGIWTGENVSCSYDICDCPCGEDVRREAASKARADGGGE